MEALSLTAGSAKRDIAETQQAPQETLMQESFFQRIERYRMRLDREDAKLAENATIGHENFIEQVQQAVSLLGGNPHLIYREQNGSPNV